MIDGREEKLHHFPPCSVRGSGMGGSPRACSVTAATVGLACALARAPRFGTLGERWQISRGVGGEEGVTELAWEAFCWHLGREELRWRLAWLLLDPIL